MNRLLKWAFILLMIPTVVHAGDSSLFYQLTSPTGVKSYLFGTMHTDDNRVTDFSPVVIDAIKAVDTFMMEVAENTDPALLARTDGDLEKDLSEAEFDQVRALADFHVMHMEQIVKMKPWLLAVIFSSPRPQTPFSQDNLLKRTSEENYKNIVGIETPQAHFGVMDRFSLDEQMTMLKAVLKKTDTQKEKDYERLMQAYLSADAAAILNIDSEITGNTLPKDLWQRMRKLLLDDRNVVMANRTIKAANEKPVFIAVGAAHLGGETGLVNAYQQAGFKLTPLKK